MLTGTLAKPVALPGVVCPQLCHSLCTAIHLAVQCDRACSQTILPATSPRPQVTVKAKESLSILSYLNIENKAAGDSYIAFLLLPETSLLAEQSLLRRMFEPGERQCSSAMTGQLQVFYFFPFPLAMRKR